MSENAFLNQTVEKINDKLDRNIYENLWTFSAIQTEMPVLPVEINKKKDFFKKTEFFSPMLLFGVLKGSVNKVQHIRTGGRPFGQQQLHKYIQIFMSEELY